MPSDPPLAVGPSSQLRCDLFVIGIQMTLFLCTSRTLQVASLLYTHRRYGVLFTTEPVYHLFVSMPFCSTSSHEIPLLSAPE